ncbi:unnamed protein product [Lactuca saligna]|uniref:DDX21/DDX50 dimerisation domain-containing protein n=1 Tax=Lactuca saligna TaxID=75948 RepID=A0AA36EFH2_LACSI|nr:unnamed protein product [Lactuca saligna]
MVSLEDSYRIAKDKCQVAAMQPPPVTTEYLFVRQHLWDSDLAINHPDYIHRSGTIGRVGNSGVAITLYEASKSNISKLEREASVKFEHISAPQPADIAKAIGGDPAEVIIQVVDSVIPVFKHLPRALGILKSSTCHSYHLWKIISHCILRLEDLFTHLPESYQVKRVSSKVARKELRMLKLAARDAGALREAKDKLEK